MEENFSEKESLKLIAEMMGKVKRSYVTKGTASIVWGILIVTCSLFTWAEAVYKFNVGFDIWLLLILALLIQIYFSIKERRSKKFVSHDEQTMTYVWTTFGICIFILSFYNSRFGGSNSATLVMMLYGIPTFITGGVFKFRPMILGGLICWIITVLSVFTSFATDMLLMASCGLFAWLIPGIILWNKHQKRKVADV